MKSQCPFSVPQDRKGFLSQPSAKGRGVGSGIDFFGSAVLYECRSEEFYLQH